MLFFRTIPRSQLLAWNPVTPSATTWWHRIAHAFAWLLGVSPLVAIGGGVILVAQEGCDGRSHNPVVLKGPFETKQISPLHPDRLALSREFDFRRPRHTGTSLKAEIRTEHVKQIAR